MDREEKQTNKRPASFPFASPQSKGHVSKKYSTSLEQYDVGQEQCDTLSSFPATDQLASEQTLKVMLISLKPVYIITTKVHCSFQTNAHEREKK